jgi:hypothetical protein
VLESLARSCSPRVEPHGDTAVVFDASGLTRVLGPPADIAREVTRLASEQGIVVRVAIAGTSTAAWCSRTRAPDRRSSSRDETVALAQIPIGWVATLPESPANDPDAAADRWSRPRRRRRAQHYRMAPLQEVRERRCECAAAARSSGPRRIPGVAIGWSCWRRSTLGLAHARRSGRAAARRCAGAARTARRRWHRAACGEDAVPLVPAGEAVRFVERLELEYAIEGLEPLAFVLGRLCDQLSTTLERADRGAAEVTLGCISSRARCTNESCICRRRCAIRACCARCYSSTPNRIRPLRPSTSSRSNWRSCPAASCKGRC